MPLSETAVWASGIIGGLLLAGALLPLTLLVLQRLRYRDPLSPALERTKSPLTRLSLVLALLGGGALTAVAVSAVIQGSVIRTTLFTTVPDLPGLPALEFSIYVDRLAAFFLLLIGGLSCGVSIYSLGYLCSTRGRVGNSQSRDSSSATELPITTAAGRPPFHYHLLPSDRVEIAVLYNLFVLTGAAFTVSSNVFFLILCLEVSTLAFGALVLHKHFEDPVGDPSGHEYRQSVKLYLIANHFGGMMIAVALLVMAYTYGQASSHGFTLNLSTWYGTAWPGPSALQSAVFLLLFAGFGIKAGVVPFHIWVAIAHPSSPTNTHAMSLGIMIKIALYGMIRTFFLLLRPFPWWWGMLVVVVAGLTAVVSVSNALHGRTLKEAFADHSVENIGIILAGIGLALVFSSQDLAYIPVVPELAGLALLAALFHLLNHTVFKGLLYLCTGAIEYLTGTVRLDELGGLIHRFRITSACFLVGAVAIAGMPPFNGFISEWLTLQAFLAGATALLDGAGNLPLVVPLLLGMLGSLLLLAVAFAMTALAFVKIVGEALLGSRRDPVSQNVLTNIAEPMRDVPLSMQIAMVTLALLCALLGVLPWFVISGLRNVTSAVAFPLDHVHSYSTLGGISISTHGYLAELRPEFLFSLAGILAFSVGIASIARQRAAQRRNVCADIAADAVWVGGTSYDAERMQYTSSAYFYAARQFLGGNIGMGFIPSSRSVDKSEGHAGLLDILRKRAGAPLEAEIIVAPGRAVGEPFRKVYNVAITLAQSLSERVSALIQNGDVRRYLTYMLAAALVIFILFAWRSS